MKYSTMGDVADEIRKMVADGMGSGAIQYALNKVIEETEGACTCGFSPNTGKRFYDDGCPIHQHGHNPARCCQECGSHATPHQGCILR